jgi:hypothetical protein
MKTGSVLGFMALIFGVAALAGAQQPPPQPLPRPPATPAPAALAVPNPLAGLRPGPRDLYQSPDGSDRFQHLSQYPAPPGIVFPGVFFPGPYFPGAYGYRGSTYDVSIADTYKMAMADTYWRRHREAARGDFVRELARGGLVLEAIPNAAQVFVDGYYVGLAEEFGPGTPIQLTAGPHRIEVRAQGYETLVVNIMIGANTIVRYRGEMQVIGSKPIATAPAPVARSVYVIPNCYAGDKRPTGTLPKGCDVKKLQTRK